MNTPTPDRATELAQWLRQYALGETTFAEERLLNEAAVLLTKSAQVEAAAGEDRKRLDWLEKHDAETFSDEGCGDGPAIWHCTVGSGNTNDRKYVCHPGDSIRAAIDAAMSAQPTPGKAGA